MWKIKTGKRQNSWSDVALATFFADFPKSVAREVEPMSACMFSIFACFSYFPATNDDSVYFAVHSISFSRQLFQKLNKKCKQKWQAFIDFYICITNSKVTNPYTILLRVQVMLIVRETVLAKAKYLFVCS